VRPAKGFDKIIETLRTGLDRARPYDIEFFLPSGAEWVRDDLKTLAPLVAASSRSRDYGRYLDDMLSVDVVMCFYDPEAYGEQMSGIATEAALLGKATLVTRGTALQRFFDRYSPGSYCAVDFTTGDLLAALTRPAALWRETQARARASMSALRELRRAERFFNVAFGLPIPAPDPRGRGLDH
jgi:hypothetical protein